MRRVFLILTFFAITVTTIAQDSAWVKANYQAASFEHVVLDIEAQTSYKIFFNRSWVDSLKITYHSDGESVPEMLSKILEPRGDYSFYVNENEIYITLGRTINTVLPTDFFNSDGHVTPSSSFDYSDFIAKRDQQQETEEQVFVIGKKSEGLVGTGTLAGQIKDSETGEPVIGASLYIEDPLIGVATDQFGYYTITVPKGRQVILIKSMGMKSTRRNVLVFGNGRMDVDLVEDITPLKEVVVESEQGLKVAGLNMGVEKLDIKTMKQIPLALGETDILKVMLALPGVQSGGEGTVGLSIRGGATNQNMILFNDAVVYNPSHLFGFFSAFNPDVLKNVELFKSGIPAEYGGRLSAVLDVQSKEGNLNKISGSVGISPVTGRIALEGPIIKNRTTFVVGARSTYSDWILKRIDYNSLNKSQANFYDLTATLSHKINNNNHIYLSSYLSKDNFSLGSDTVYSYRDRNASIKWKHTFNNKLYSVTSASLSQYEYGIRSDENPFEAFQMDFSVNQVAGKIDFNYFPNSKHHVTAGVNAINYQLEPGRLRPIGTESLVATKDIQHERGLEMAFYIGDQYEINPKLAIYGGIRYSKFYSLGPRTVYDYNPEDAKDVANITDTLFYNRGETVAQYGGIEPRLSVRYLLPRNASLKFSYNRMYQYIQMLSNSTAINPTDTWKLSDQHVRPQSGDQWSLGYYRNLKNNLIEASVEVYYKRIRSTLDYKGGAQLLLNQQLETDLLEADGKAYGIEILFKKSVGRLNGWISYTFSRSFLRSTGKFKEEIINNGQYYPSYYDVPHAVNFIGNYKFNRRINFSLNTVYSTGRPITLPIASYQQEGVERVYYSERNKFRIPDYFRMDISVNLEGNHKVTKRAHGSWTFAVYNLLGRANAYSVFFKNEGSLIKGYKLSVFPNPIPTLTYNLKF